MIVWNDSKHGQDGRKRYLVPCPCCGRQDRYLCCSDAKRAEANNTPCFNCSQSIRGKKGYAVTYAKHPRIAQRRAHEWRKAKQGSKPEQKVEKILNRLNIAYEREYAVYGSWRDYYADFCIPARKNIIIEVNSERYHGSKQQRENDKRRNNGLRRHGFAVCVVWESWSDEKIERKIMQFLKRYC